MIAKAKEQLLHYGRQMIARSLTTGSGGNLSTLLKTENQLIITPSGMEYNDMTIGDLVVCDRDGRVVEGRRRPSSEMGFHLALYRQRPEIGAVVHTHSVYATTLACMHREIPPVHYLVGFSGPKVPLAPYATFGTQALAEAVVSHIGTCNAVLLANHGLVAVGQDLTAAFNVAEEIELVARIYYQTLVAGEPKILSETQMAEALKKFKTYGQPSNGSEEMTR
jgi:L-fuculose-phosphate aldolase